MYSVIQNVLRKTLKNNLLFSVLCKKKRKIHSSSVNYFLDHSPNARVNKTLMDKYMRLPIDPCAVQLEYIWIDGTGENVRSKSRTANFIPECPDDLPRWSFDGSSTYQATTDRSDVTLVPVAIYKDPVRGDNHKLVLCETYNIENQPMGSNHRNACKEAFEKTANEEPWFGIEQEYSLTGPDLRPYGWEVNSYPAPQGPYYCGVGAEKAFARDIVEAHYRACLYCGVNIYGVNAEVMPSQWEFQVGPTSGIAAADELWIARYLLHRIGEEYGIGVTLHPKLLPNWNGAGAHTNFSTKTSRNDNGIEALHSYIEKLSKKHKEHLAVYDPTGGVVNSLRLTGIHETSSMETFSSGVGNRGASVRIQPAVERNKKGYLEDRRPASNCDPYCVMNAILRTCLID